MSEQIAPEQKQEVIVTFEKRIACDGPADSKHPRVYLTFNNGETDVVCPYCSRVYHRELPSK